MLKSITKTVLALAAALTPTIVCAQTYSAATTQLVSKGSFAGAIESSENSYEPRVSKNGRFVVFTSTAANLVNSPSVTPGRQQVYLFDRQSNTVELASKTHYEAQSPVDCFHPAVSNDGRYVSFTCSTMADSDVAAMVETGLGAENHLNIPIGGQHIYVRDRLANDTLLVTQVVLAVKRQARDSFGVPQVEAEPDGNGGKRPVLESVTYRVAAFRWNGTSEGGCIQNTNSNSVVVRCPSLSDNSRMSGDGRYNVYDTDANNLAPVGTQDALYPTLVRTTDYDATTGIVLPSAERIFFPEAYFQDGNDSIRDIYVRDGADNSNSMVNFFCQYYDVTKCPVQGTLDSFKPSISDDGKYVTFHTATPFLSLDFNNTSDVYLVERGLVNGEISKLTRVSNDTTRILAGNGASTNATISGDGRYVAFESTASNLTVGDTNGQKDVFLYDRNFNGSVLCSKSGTLPSNGSSANASVSGSGEYVSFDSDATNFAISTTTRNAYVAKTVRDTTGRLTQCSVSLASTGSGAGANASTSFTGVAVVPETSTNGTRSLRSSLVYQSDATNVSSATDTNGKSDIFQAPTCSTLDLNTDTDGDGTTDCFDQCYKDPVKVEDFDTDGDGFADCEDGCKSDPQKQDAGICGCGIQDVDSDGDGAFDCKDLCPADPSKKAPGACGCGRPDLDNNNNGVIDCTESSTPISTPVPTPVGTTPPGVTPVPGGDVATRLRNFIPPAPKVSRQGTGYVNAKFNFNTVPAGVEISDIRLTVYKSGTRKSATISDAYYGKKLKLPKGFDSGKLIFSAQYRAKIGSETIRSQEGTKSEQVTVAAKR